MAVKKKHREQPRKKAGTLPTKKTSVFVAEPGDVGAFLEDLDVELEARCGMILFEAQRRADQLKNAFSSELIKLPKQIRTMSVRSFCEQYGGEISSVLEHERQSVLHATGFNRAAPGSVLLRSERAISQTRGLQETKGGTLKRSPAAPRSVRKPMVAATPVRGSPAQSVFQTPRFDPRLPATPATVLAVNKPVRQLRRGESIMSINGSPLVAAPDTMAPIELVLQDPSRLTQQLAGESKAEQATKIAALKSQLAEMMEKLGEPGTPGPSSEKVNN